MNLRDEDAAGETRARLRRRVQIGYAAADVGVNGIELAIRLYLLIFYTDRVGLSPSLAGLALGVGLVWDAITDPVNVMAPMARPSVISNRLAPLILPTAPMPKAAGA